jgi:CRP-like cAMP-binding protein
MSDHTIQNELIDYLSSYMPLNEDEKRAIVDLDVFRSYKKNTILVKEGQMCNYAYFVIKGCIRRYYIIDGEEKTTAFYTEMESLTPQSFLKQKPSEYYVGSVEDVILIVSNNEMEKIMFEKFPRFETLCRILTEQLVAQNQATFDEFKTSSPEQRYLQLVSSRPDLIQRVPQHQLASYLGITPQSLSRMRSRLVSARS